MSDQTGDTLTAAEKIKKAEEAQRYVRKAINLLFETGDSELITKAMKVLTSAQGDVHEVIDAFTLELPGYVQIKRVSSVQRMGSTRHDWLVNNKPFITIQYDTTGAIECFDEFNEWAGETAMIDDGEIKVELGTIFKMILTTKQGPQMDGETIIWQESKDMVNSLKIAKLL